MKYQISGAVVCTPQRMQKCDVLVENGRIVALSPQLPPLQDGVTFSFSGCYLFPGFADSHVHLREPGFSYKETIASGTKSAARGGYTAVCSMPNLNPVPDCLANLAVQEDCIARDAVIAVHPYGAITRGEQGRELADLAALAPHVAGFSDDGRGVQEEEMMRAAMREAARLQKCIVAHCEVDSLLRGGYIHEGSYARAHGHRGISSESEWRQVERDLKLVRETGCAYHVCHVSTRESIAQIREAKRQGLNVTCETAPHYLILTEEDLQEDARFKMNPPLREPADREALRAALLDGTIDMIATDHAPHSAEEKGRGLQKSAMGIVGLETAFCLLYTHLVKTGLLPLQRLIALLTEGPKRRFSLGDPLAVGAAADLTVFDLERSYVIDPNEFVSLGRSTPFAGERVWGRCLLTMAQGKLVWEE